MRRSSQPYTENLSAEDYDALLSFPYHEYKDLGANVKQEVIENPVPGPSNAEPIYDSLFSNAPIQVQYDDGEVSPYDIPAIQRAGLKIIACQRKLVQVMNKVNNALKASSDKQELEQIFAKEEERLASLAKEELSDIRPISLFAAPYFRDVRGMVPPDNEDTIAKKKNQEVDAYLAPPKPWTKVENKRLLNGVATNALNQCLKPLKMKRDFLKSKLKDKDLLEFELDVIKKQLLSLDKKIKRMSEKPIVESLEECGDQIDWMTISATNMEGTRSPEECESMWKNYLNVSVNKTSFTAEEDKKLKDLAEIYEERDWDVIAEELETNRTAIQCFERFQTKLNKNITRKFWTKEEDEHLTQIVESVRIGDFVPWNKVCCYMEGRTRAQIMNRYERSVSKQNVRSRWTSKEDAMLIACVLKIGYEWRKMKPFLPGRNPYACRERYMNTLNPSLRIGNWTKEEDMQLINAIREHGYGKWAKICRQLPGRTDNMCLMRADRLKAHSVKKSKVFKHREEDVDDPVIISQILKPVAPTKLCEIQNFRLQNVRRTAFNHLLNALKIIQPNVKYEADLEKLDLCSAGPNILHQIYSELSKIKIEPPDVKQNDVRKRRNYTKRRAKVQRITEDNIPYADTSDDSLCHEYVEAKRKISNINSEPSDSNPPSEKREYRERQAKVKRITENNIPNTDESDDSLNLENEGERGGLSKIKSELPDVIPQYEKRKRKYKKREAKVQHITEHNIPDADESVDSPSLENNLPNKRSLSKIKSEIQNGVQSLFEKSKRNYRKRKAKVQHITKEYISDTDESDGSLSLQNERGDSIEEELSNHSEPSDVKPDIGKLTRNYGKGESVVQCTTESNVDEDTDESDDSESLEEEEENLIDREPNSIDDELLKIEDVLNVEFDMMALKHGVNPPKKFVALSSRASLEQALCQVFLLNRYDSFGTSVVHGDGDGDDDNDNDDSTDSQVALDEVINKLAQPNKGQFTVLSPNVTTLDALDTSLLTQTRLRLMAKYIHHSQVSLRYLKGMSEGFTKCLYCRLKSRESFSFTRNLDPVKKALERDQFAVDDILGQALFNEYGNPTQISDKCACRELLEVKQWLDTLKKRVTSMLLWPKLFWIAGFNDLQELLSQLPPRTDVKKPPQDSSIQNPLPKKKKRGRPKGFRLNEEQIKRAGRPKSFKSENPVDENPDQQTRTKNRSPLKRPEDESLDDSSLRRSKRGCVMQRKSFTTSP